MLGALLFLHYGVGDPLFWTARQALSWGQRTTWPHETLIVAFNHVLGEGRITINTFDLAALLLFLVLAIGSFRLRWSYGLYSLLMLVPTLLHVGPQFPLMSSSRFLLVAFPCFIVLALWTSRRPRIVHLLIISLWIGFLLVWTSHFIGGHWVG
jgi:hypothetical protein